MKIQELRTELGISQRELALRLNVSPGNLCDWEKGRTQPDVNKLIEIADALDVSIDELVGRDVRDTILKDKKSIPVQQHEEKAPLVIRLTKNDRRMILAYKKLSSSAQEHLIKFIESVVDDE